MNSNQQSIELYKSRAEGYDASAEYTMPLRRRTIELLHLREGQTVLDVGCGTGLSYPLLAQCVGPTGKILGFEQSPAMFALAEQRRAKMQASNVWHVNEAAEKVQLPCLADAVLFNYTHDICCTPDAIDNIMRQLKPQARVAMAGMKFFPWWVGPLNILPWLKNRPYNAKASQLWRPWQHVAKTCTHFDWQSTHWGMGYIASGIYTPE